MICTAIPGAAFTKPPIQNALSPKPLPFSSNKYFVTPHTKRPDSMAHISEM